VRDSFVLEKKIIIITHPSVFSPIAREISSKSDFLIAQRYRKLTFFIILRRRNIYCKYSENLYNKF